MLDYLMDRFLGWGLALFAVGIVAACVLSILAGHRRDRETCTHMRSLARTARDSILVMQACDLSRESPGPVVMPVYMPVR